jgi:hypothetical protein
MIKFVEGIEMEESSILGFSETIHNYLNPVSVLAIR